MSPRLKLYLAPDECALPMGPNLSPSTSWSSARPRIRMMPGLSFYPSQDGIRELDIQRLSHFIRSRYGSMNDAKRKLGTTGEISSAFLDIQRRFFSSVGEFG